MISAGDGLAGTVRWAIVPYVPRPPFRLYAGEGHAPISAPDTDAIVAGVREKSGDADLTYLVAGKVRPVLILNDPPAPRYPQDVTALRLLRLAKLEGSEQTTVRDQKDPLLFYLVPDRFNLQEENAAMVSAIVRVHVDAIESGQALGRLNDNEMRVLGERIVRFYRFDVRLLVEQRIREIVARKKEAS